jgi:glycosyltransferase involved in cell wall biosynthesis
MKPSVLLDIGFLGLAFERKSAARGVERQVFHLFQDLPASRDCDLSFVATTHLAATYDFLKAKRIEPEEKLKCSSSQLARSRRARRLTQKIHAALNSRGLPARAARKLWSLQAQWLTRNEMAVTTADLAGMDIYHTPHTTFPLAFLPPAVEIDRRIKKFVTMHDFIAVKNPEYFSKNPRVPFRRMLDHLPETTFAFCASASVRADILELTRLRPERIFLAPPAADPNLFYPVTDAASLAATRREFGLSDAPYFLALSVNEPHKNFGHLIRCLAALIESNELPDHNLVIAGSNAARNPLLTGVMAKHPRLTGRVLTPGFVPDEKLAALYSGATAFLFPSLAEGFGLPPLEAMQCGVPVISSNTTSMPEVVGDAGILLPPTDVDAWCQAMLRVVRDGTLRTELAGKSLARSRAFTWENYIAAVIQGYQSSLGDL